MKSRGSEGGERSQDTAWSPFRQDKGYRSNTNKIEGLASREDRNKTFKISLPTLGVPTHPSIDFFVEGDENRAEFSNWLKDLATSLENGSIELEQDQRQLTLRIPDTLEYEFKVEHDPKNRVVIHLHIHYFEDRHKSEEKSFLPRIGRR